MQAHAASGRRLVLLTSDGGDLEQAVRVARQLARFNLSSETLVLTDSNVTCSKLHHLLPGLGCGASGAFVRRFARCDTSRQPTTANPTHLTPVPSAPHGPRRCRRPLARYGASTRLWALWASKWLLVKRLVEVERLDVLALDSDMLVLADPFTWLQQVCRQRWFLVHTAPWLTFFQAAPDG